MVLQQPARFIPIPPLESGDRLTGAEAEYLSLQWGTGIFGMANL